MVLQSMRRSQREHTQKRRNMKKNPIKLDSLSSHLEETESTQRYLLEKLHQPKDPHNREIPE